MQFKRSKGFFYVLLLAIFLAPIAFSCLSPAIAQSDDIWLLIDTRALTLSIMREDSPLRVYQNIAIGSNGPTWSKRVSDEKTPLGDFRIDDIRTSERFQVFLSIDYPTMADARRALKDKRISAAEYEVLNLAWMKGDAPPQTTSLGGNLGIHGLGAGSVEIHNRINWTDGCIALTNEQVQELAAWVTVGIRVNIR